MLCIISFNKICLTIAHWHKTTFSSVALSVNLDIFNQVQFGQETAFGFILDKRSVYNNPFSS